MKEEEEPTMAAAAAQDVKYKVPAPSFSGDGTTRAAISREYHQFVRKFEAYATAVELKEEQMVAQAALCFKKDSSADKWFYNLDRMETVRTWDTLKGHMATRFAEEWDAAALLQERVKLQQKPGESVDQFCDRIQDFQIVIDEQRRTDGLTAATVKQLHKTDVYTIFLGGLKEPIKSNLLKKSDLNDLEALLKAAKKEEMYDKFSTRSISNVEEEEQIAAADGAKPKPKERTSWLAKPTKRPKWVTLRMIPREYCARCAKKGHRGSECTTPLEQQQWEKLLPIIQQNSGGGQKNGPPWAKNNAGGSSKQASMNLMQQVGVDSEGAPIYKFIAPPPATGQGGPPTDAGGPTVQSVTGQVFFPGGGGGNDGPSGSYSDF